MDKGSEELNTVSHELRTTAKRWSNVIRAMWILVIVAFLLACWVATLEYRQRYDKSGVDRIDMILRQNHLQELRIQRIEDLQDKNLTTLEEMKEEIEQ